MPSGSYALSSRKIHASSDHGVSGDSLRKLHSKFHLGCFRLVKGISLGISHFSGHDGEGAQVRAYDLQFVTFAELVVQAAQGKAVFVSGLHLCNDLPLS